MASPEYRFAVVCTAGPKTEVNNLVMVFAFTKPAARLHKKDMETAYPGFTFEIKPTRRQADGQYLVG